MEVLLVPEVHLHHIVDSADEGRVGDVVDGDHVVDNNMVDESFCGTVMPSYCDKLLFR